MTAKKGVPGRQPETQVPSKGASRRIAQQVTTSTSHKCPFHHMARGSKARPRRYLQTKEETGK